MAVMQQSTFEAERSASIRPKTSTSHRKSDRLELPKSAGRLARSNSASNVLDTHNEFHRRLYDPELAPHLQRKSARSAKENGLTNMIEFLRDTEPPPSNFMSIPDGQDERGRGWARWANLGRSKSVPRGPRSIRLPDTAVSGTTIGGHRHIAITIPSRAFPLGELTRSQYPIYSAPVYSIVDEKRPIASPNGFYQTIVNDKGTVTVLRNVNEKDRLSPQRNARQTSSRNGRGASRGSASLPPSRGSGTVTFADDKTKTPIIPLRGSPGRFPARASSRSRAMAHQPASIDSIIAEDDEYPRSLLDVADDEFRREAAAELYAKKPLPEIRGKNGTLSQQQDETDKTDKPAKVVSQAGEDRRVKVRSKKQRDLEALLSLRKRMQAAERNGSSTPTPERSSVGSEQDVQRAGQPTLTPIQVVINVEPTLDFDTKLKTTKSAKAQKQEPQTLGPTQVADRDSSSTEGSDSASPRPLSVTPRKTTPRDRTALSRRREWNATRQQERQNKEGRPSVMARAKQLAASMNEDASDTQAVDREILRLYEAFREHRFREMERRLRRLERNGDIWLRALVPVLQSLHYGGVPRPDSAPVPGQEEESEDTASLYGSVAESEADGLDAIEPLMRELAGAAVLRQMRSGKLLPVY